MLSGKRVFFGFGFGPIQSGLFIYEAYQSNQFKRLSVAEIDPFIVDSIKKSNGFFTINVAHRSRIEKTSIGPIEIYNPNIDVDREEIIEEIALADEIATAVPSVLHYHINNQTSLDRILATGILRKIERNGPNTLIYAAENNNNAAELLREHVLSLIPISLHQTVFQSIQFLNTVIGKMSQVVNDEKEIIMRDLAPITDGFGKSFLVESFNEILISQVEQKGKFKRGITVLKEKKGNLLPFEEAKLFGHNAAHALLGYLGSWVGIRLVSEANQIAGFMRFIRNAFLQESGEYLIRKNQGFDALFSERGFRIYVDDLLERMTNSFLGDSIERVIRDPRRKLAWNDRLIGTMENALQFGIQPNRYALGAAAAVVRLDRRFADDETIAKKLLPSIWKDIPHRRGDEEKIIDLILNARKKLVGWKKAGFPHLEDYFQNNSIPE